MPCSTIGVSLDGVTDTDELPYAAIENFQIDRMRRIRKSLRAIKIPTIKKDALYSLFICIGPELDVGRDGETLIPSSRPVTGRLTSSTTKPRMKEQTARLTQAYFNGKQNKLVLRRPRTLDLSGPEPSPDAWTLLRWIASQPVGETRYSAGQVNPTNARVDTFEHYMRDRIIENSVYRGYVPEENDRLVVHICTNLSPQ
ncbi:hypothetical protein ARSEF1564_004316 [Beauveria bassiana]